MATREAPARRYFGVLAVVLIAMYLLVFFTGSSRTPALGLDLRGGTTVTLTARLPGGGTPSQADLELARQIIDQRVNGLGVSGAEVVTQGNTNIVISVPGDNSQQARELGATAQLRLRPVVDGPAAATASTSSSAPASASGSASAGGSASASVSGSAASASGATAAPASGGASSSAAASTSSAPAGASASGSAAAASGTPTGSAAASATANGLPAPKPGSPAITQAQAEAAYATLTCGTSNATGEVYRPTDYVATCSTDGTAKYVVGPAIIEGTQITSASAATQQTTGAWEVLVTFNTAGTSTWASYTAAHIGKAVAFTLDGRVVSAPTIQSAITGQTSITGNFTQQQATELANQLKYGALPLTFTQATAESISTELGATQLRDGLIAGAIGLALVVLYALLYYRLLGLVMIASLGVSGALVYGSLVLLGRQIGFTLSLAGIAGFIVAIGITADSFVVYFERIKDEIREGRTLRSAVPRAWVRARRTILSADAVSFLAAAILYLLAIGDVKGFAFTLGLSTVLDLVVVFLFTHPLMVVLSKLRSFGSSRMSGLGRVDRRRGPTSTPPPNARPLVGAGGSRAGGQNRSRS